MRRILLPAHFAILAFALVPLAANAAEPAKDGAKPTVAKSAPEASTAGKSAPAKSAPAKNAAKPPPEPIILEGEDEGTVLKSLTVTGEDLIHVEFERPELRLDLDPRQAPGLDWGDASEMLDASGVDVVKPLTTLSVWDSSPYLAKPWLDGYKSGAVARFQPQMSGVERWWLTIADSRSDTLATMEGKGNPPKEIAWDGRARDGGAVHPGITCSYVLEAVDRAGNRRSFVGPGFVLSAYRVRTDDAEILLFSGEDLGDGAALASKTGTAPSIVLETASWLNQISPASGAIEVKVAGRSFEEADRLATALAKSLQQRVVGDPARIRHVAEVRADLPIRGTVTITADRTRSSS